MKNKPLLFGAVGTVLAAIGCFTPFLVIGVVAAGAAGVVSYLDYVLFPLLGFCVLLTIYGFIRMRRARKNLSAPSPLAEGAGSGD